MRAFCLPPPLKSLELDPEKSVFVRSKSVGLLPLCTWKLQQVCVHESGCGSVPSETIWSLEELCFFTSYEEDKNL